jgi:alcohol dehydrogenase
MSLVRVAAHQAAYELVNLQPGQTVFMTGGTTAIGIYATRMAKSLGLKDITSTPGKHEEFLRNFGIEGVSSGSPRSGLPKC